MELDAEVAKIINEAEYQSATDQVARLTKQHYDAMMAQGFDREQAMEFAHELHAMLCERMWEVKSE